VTTGVPQGSVLGPVLFNIFDGNMDSVIEHTLSKFDDDTKLHGAVDTLEGRDTVQRDLDRLERWAHVNIMKLHKVKCKALHINQGNPKHKYRLGREWIKSSPEEQDLGVPVDGKLNMARHHALTAGLHQKQRGQQVEGGDSAPLLYSGETLPGVLHPALEPSAQERHGPAGVGPEEATKMVPKKVLPFFPLILLPIPPRRGKE